MIGKSLALLLVAAVLLGPTIPAALAYKSLKVPEAYPKVEPFNPRWKKSGTYVPYRTWWRHHGWR